MMCEEFQKSFFSQAILAVLLSADGYMAGFLEHEFQNQTRLLQSEKVFGATLEDLSKKLFRSYLISWGIASVLEVSYLV